MGVVCFRRLKWQKAQYKTCILFHVLAVRLLLRRQPCFRVEPGSADLKSLINLFNHFNPSFKYSNLISTQDRSLIYFTWKRMASTWPQRPHAFHLRNLPSHQIVLRPITRLSQSVSLPIVCALVVIAGWITANLHVCIPNPFYFLYLQGQPHSPDISINIGHPKLPMRPSCPTPTPQRTRRRLLPTWRSTLKIILNGADCGQRRADRVEGRKGGGARGSCWHSSSCMDGCCWAGTNEYE